MFRRRVGSFLSKATNCRSGRDKHDASAPCLSHARPDCLRKDEGSLNGNVNLFPPFRIANALNLSLFQDGGVVNEGAGGTAIRKRRTNCVFGSARITEVDYVRMHLRSDLGQRSTHLLEFVPRMSNSASFMPIRPNS